MIRPRRSPISNALWRCDPQTGLARVAAPPIGGAAGRRGVTGVNEDWRASLLDPVCLFRRRRRDSNPARRDARPTRRRAPILLIGHGPDRCHDRQPLSRSAATGDPTSSCSVSFAISASSGRSSIGDPGYQALNWLVQEWNGEIWWVNSVSAAIFAWGLIRLCQNQPRPMLAVLVAVPYLIIVVAMGYTRQSIAIGILMAGLASLGRGGSVIRFAIYVAVAALVPSHRGAGSSAGDFRRGTQPDPQRPRRRRGIGAVLRPVPVGFDRSVREGLYRNPLFFAGRVDPGDPQSRSSGPAADQARALRLHSAGRKSVALHRDRGLRSCRSS